MTTLLPRLNSDLGELADLVRQSLVQVLAGPNCVGSGVVISADGLIITNAHVVSAKGGHRADADFRLVLPDGSVTTAKLIAKDGDRDVAALKISQLGGNPPDLHAIQVGDSRALPAGQWVLAMGHPWGVSGVAAAGIVIGAGADLAEAPGSGRDWIAVDVALRPGNSGGPLVDHQGRLIGISAMMAGLEVGMAVPAHVIVEFMEGVDAGVR